MDLMQVTMCKQSDFVTGFIVFFRIYKHLLQAILLCETPQLGLQIDDLGLFADYLNVKLIAPLFQFTDLLAVLVLVDQALGELLLRVVP